jgi:hypothetical protein
VRSVREFLTRPVALFAVGALAAAVRVVFAVAKADAPPAVDSDLYRELARNLTDGSGYALLDRAGELSPTAQHPPAFPFVLAALDQVGLTTELDQRVVLAFVASIGVVLTGFLARHVAGPAVGVVAAVVAALHPLWFQHAGFGVSESVYLVVVPGMLLLAARAVDRPTPLRMALLGAAVGLAALTRSEGILFAVALVVPVGVIAAPSWKRRLVAIAVALAATGLVLLPWVARNAAEFDALTLSTNRGATLLGGWNDSTFGTHLGGWDLYHVIPAVDEIHETAPPSGHREWDEIAVDEELTDRALRYARSHIGEVPKVLLARLGRTAGVYRLDDQRFFDWFEGRDFTLQRVGQIVHLVLLALAVFGATRVARRYLAVLLAGPVVAVLVVTMFYGSTRMRVPAEPAIAVLAAVGGVAIARTIGTRSTRRPAAAVGAATPR